ncbi:amino acid permease [Clostridium aciditolerans]|uniref:Amino acid permease n=1 Tax=Clostridium aciditolerans TaxID=339861 RepID=A0A934M508_9CLOT|nr:amino acid permease [Clostridium aciditolerans]MBI6874590.1 amino acid permease [Clostridium aciditolerans]
MKEKRINSSKITDKDEFLADEFSVQENNKGTENHLSAMNLMWIGIGGTIGSSFFLASGLPISYAGPGVVFSYLLGGLLACQIAGALTSLSVNHPVSGSFKVYAEEILGPFMGFYVGWTFWIGVVLSIGSETIAMAIFSKLWFPNAPVWLLTIVYSAIVIALNAFGLKNFGKVETIMSFIKVAALVLFIIIGAAAMFGVFYTNHPVGIKTLLDNGGLFPKGLRGLLQSMLIVIFSYAGIGVVAMASSEVRNPRRDIPKAMLLLILILVLLYAVSILTVVCLIPWNTISIKQSPFISALELINIPFAASIMNAVVLVASFSVMTGSYFSAIMMLVALGNSHQAPAFVSKESKNGVFYGSLILTAIGLVAIIITSYILPGKIYSYLISASAYFSFISLGIILVCFLIWRKTVANQDIYKSPLAFGAPWSTVITLVILVLLFIFSLGVIDQRMGFYFALGISVVISIAYLFIRGKSKDTA